MFLSNIVWLKKTHSFKYAYIIEYLTIARLKPRLIEEDIYSKGDKGQMFRICVFCWEKDISKHSEPLSPMKNIQKPWHILQLNILYFYHYLPSLQKTDFEIKLTQELSICSWHSACNSGRSQWHISVFFQL